MTTKEVYNAIFKVGKKYTILYIDSMMAMSHSKKIVVRDITEAGIIYTAGRGRKKFILKYSQKTYSSQAESTNKDAIFEGWEMPILCDSEQGGIIRGNACINLMGTPKDIRSWIDTCNLNPNLDKSNILSIVDEVETVVYPELVVTGTHAVIDRILEKN